MSPGFESGRLPTVLLRHELPDGSWHVDWMIARDPRGREPLLTFRLASRVDELRPKHQMHAEQLADHRSAYLSYEGPISGGRGTVTRLRKGVAVILEAERDHLRIGVSWGDHVDANAIAQDLAVRTDPADALTCDGGQPSRWIVTCTRQGAAGASQCANHDPAAAGR